MNNPVPQKPICGRCTAVLDADDNYCRRCGVPTSFGIAAGILPPARPPAIWESPWAILPLLFLVIGPLAFPLLWRSRQFTMFWKCSLTIVVTSITIFLFWFSWFVTQQQLTPLLKALGG
jgi:hypothetical protein